MNCFNRIENVDSSRVYICFGFCCGRSSIERIFQTQIYVWNVNEEHIFGILWNFPHFPMFGSRDIKVGSFSTKLNLKQVGVMSWLHISDHFLNLQQFYTTKLWYIHTINASWAVEFLKLYMPRGKIVTLISPRSKQ